MRIPPVRTITYVTNRLKKPQEIKEVPAPVYTGDQESPKIMLAVEAMKRHTADAGWQLQTGLRQAGYSLWGKDFANDEVDVPTILERTSPGTLVIQDKREWEGKTAQQTPYMRFTNAECLKDLNDVFKLTVLKDAHHRNGYHRKSAEEMGVHGWIIYYHPRIVKYVAPFIRVKHCIRTYHSVDSSKVPDYITPTQSVLLSGACSMHYPLRKYLLSHRRQLPMITYAPHPGYRATGCVTPQYLILLSQFKVAICTSSRYGYTLRKIIEATACGCKVLTDLPVDDPLPEIDGNLTRVNSNVTVEQIRSLLKEMVESYDPIQQRAFAERARQWYDWRAVGTRLAENIERLRQGFTQ